MAASTFSATGPNSVSYTVAGLPLAVNGAVMVAKASPPGAAASGAVDVSVVASNATGTPASGNWNLNVYAGCAAVNGVFSYGTASTVTAAPPALPTCNSIRRRASTCRQAAPPAVPAILGATRGRFGRDDGRQRIPDIDGSCDSGELMRVLILFLFSVSLQAATYYVGSAGNDSNPGTSDAPWLTLQHAVNSVACGDTIIVVAKPCFCCKTPPRTWLRADHDDPIVRLVAV